MNIEEIKSIVNNDFLPDKSKEIAIINILSQDKNVIPTLLKILEQERKVKNELITDMNLELSRADEYIREPILFAKDKQSKNKDLKLNQAREFIINNITIFYHKYRDVITHCFNKQF